MLPSFWEHTPTCFLLVVVQGSGSAAVVVAVVVATESVPGAVVAAGEARMGHEAGWWSRGYGRHSKRSDLHTVKQKPNFENCKDCGALRRPHGQMKVHGV